MEDHVDASATTTPVPPAGPPPGGDGKERKGCVKWVLIGVAVVIALIVGLVVLVFTSTKGVAKESKRFAQAVVANDKELAWSMTSTGFREATSQAGLNELIDRLYGIVPDAKISGQGRAIYKSTGKPTMGVATFKVSAEARTAYFKVVVVKQSGKWRVFNFESSEKALSTELDE